MNQISEARAHLLELVNGSERLYLNDPEIFHGVALIVFIAAVIAILVGKWLIGAIKEIRFGVQVARKERNAETGNSIIPGRL